MLSIKCFSFNPAQVNMYILHDLAGNTVIIDPAVYDEHEKKLVLGYIEKHNLTIQAQWLTHSHIDHIVGSAWVHKTFKVPLLMHKDGLEIFHAAPEYGRMFGFNVLEYAKPNTFYTTDFLMIGSSKIIILETPGHANGSVCFYDAESGFVITGDVLFHETIGRTDLPSGDYQTLITNIETKLLTLPDNTIVYPGHGHHTTIGNEKKNNPFLKVINS